MKVIFIISLLVSFSANSQKEWSLQECIDSMMVNNQSIQISALDLSEAEIRQKNTIYTFLPSLNGGFAHGYNWGQTIDPFTNQFANSRVQYNNFYLNSGVVLFSGLQKYYAKKIVDVDLSIQQLNNEQIKRNKQIEVAAAYLQSMLNLEIETIAKKQLEGTKIQLSNEEKLVEEEFRTNADLLKVKAQLSKDQLKVTQAGINYRTSLLALQQLMGRSYDTTFTISLNYDLSFGADLSGSKFPIEEKLVELNATKQQMEIAKAKGGFSPTFSLNGSIGSGYSGNNTFINANGDLIPKPFPDQLDENFYQFISVNLNVPIFNNNTSKRDLDIQKIEFQRNQLENETLVLTRENKIEMLELELLNNKASIKSLEVVQTSVAMEYENNKLLYNSNEIIYLDLITSKDELFRINSQLIQEKYKLLFNQLILKLL